MEVEVVPWNRQLVTTELAINWGMKSDTCEECLKWKLTKEKKIFKIELDTKDKILELEKESHKKQEKILLTELKKEKRKKIITHPAVVATITVALVVLIEYGSIKLYNALSD